MNTPKVVLFSNIKQLYNTMSQHEARLKTSKYENKPSITACMNLCIRCIHLLTEFSNLFSKKIFFAYSVNVFHCYYWT